MGESELFPDLKSDFERSYRSEMLIAGLPAPEDQNLWRLAVTMACLSSTERKIAVGPPGQAKKPSLQPSAYLSVDV